MLHTNKLATKSHIKLERLPIFYKEFFKLLVNPKIQRKQIKLLSDFLIQWLWGNKVFHYKNKAFVFENWYDAGILYVKDIVDENDIKLIEYLLNQLEKVTYFVSILN
jgi:hypothetical protein